MEAEISSPNLARIRDRFYSCEVNCSFSKEFSGARLLKQTLIVPRPFGASPSLMVVWQPAPACTLLALSHGAVSAHLWGMNERAVPIHKDARLPQNLMNGRSPALLTHIPPPSSAPHAGGENSLMDRAGAEGAELSSTTSNEGEWRGYPSITAQSTQTQSLRQEMLFIH